MVFYNFIFKKYTEYIKMTKKSTDSFFLHITINPDCSEGKHLKVTLAELVIAFLRL
jgi:hypothetical protein